MTALCKVKCVVACVVRRDALRDMVQGDVMHPIIEIRVRHACGRISHPVSHGGFARVLHHSKWIRRPP